MFGLWGLFLRVVLAGAVNDIFALRILLLDGVGVGIPLLATFISL